MLDLAVLFELSKTVIPNQRFDIVLHSPKDFVKPDTRAWHGSVWGDLTTLIPFSTQKHKAKLEMSPIKKGNAGPIPIFEGSVEHMLQLIFTRFETREYQEGLFLLKAEFGADWFTPVLQHPHCVIRQPPRQNKSSPQDIDLLNRDLMDNPESLLTPEPSPYIANSKKDVDQQPKQVETFVVFYLGPNVKDFCAAFHAIGLIPGVNSWYLL
ncbi:hypothetical protein EDD86DRAFT_196771 [Gorgonomyces haynaldii]|nr:hypothetical protein EDD86DRAFT_196771 [Gorgonomyces haynaldii]